MNSKQIEVTYLTTRGALCVETAQLECDPKITGGGFFEFCRCLFSDGFELPKPDSAGPDWAPRVIAPAAILSVKKPR